jgi:hypothetical protein
MANELANAAVWNWSTRDRTVSIKNNKSSQIFLRIVRDLNVVRSSVPPWPSSPGDAGVISLGQFSFDVSINPGQTVLTISGGTKVTATVKQCTDPRPLFRFVVYDATPNSNNNAIGVVGNFDSDVDLEVEAATVQDNDPDPPTPPSRTLVIP